MIRRISHSTVGSHRQGISNRFLIKVGSKLRDDTDFKLRNCFREANDCARFECVSAFLVAWHFEVSYRKNNAEKSLLKKEILEKRTSVAFMKTYPCNLQSCPEKDWRGNPPRSDVWDLNTSFRLNSFLFDYEG